MDESTFYWQLYAALISNCPIESGNMVAHISLENMGDGIWKITITALSKKGYDYARAVNYALAARVRMMKGGSSETQASGNIILADKMTFQEIRDSRPDMNRKSGALGISAKEAQNYMWVERTIRQVAELFGGNVNYELQ